MKFMDLRFGSIVVSIICSVVFKLFSCMGNGDIGTYVPFWLVACLFDSVSIICVRAFIFSLVILISGGLIRFLGDGVGRVYSRISCCKSSSGFICLLYMIWISCFVLSATDFGGLLFWIRFTNSLILYLDAVNSLIVSPVCSGGTRIYDPISLALHNGIPRSSELACQCWVSIYTESLSCCLIVSIAFYRCVS